MILIFVVPQVFTHNYVAIIHRMIETKSQTNDFLFAIHVYEDKSSKEGFRDARSMACNRNDHTNL